MLPLVIVSSLIDSFNPCAFSILILTIAFLFSLGKTRSKILVIGSVYILGIFIIYVLIGLGILKTLDLFNVPHFMSKFGAGLLIAFGFLEVANHLFPNFPVKIRIPKGSHSQIARLMEKGSVPAAFALGGFVGICEFPCTGGPYLMILSLLHDQASFWNGFWYLILYNVVFIIPLAVILIIASSKVLLDKVQQWKNRENSNMRLWGGTAMIGLGILMLFLY